MSEDIYAKLDLTKKVRFQKSENEDKNADACDDTNNSANRDNSIIYDNCWVEGSTPPKLEDSVTEDQQQIVSVNANSKNKRNLVRAAAVFLALLCVLLLATVIFLLIQNTRLNTLSRERDQLQTNYSHVLGLNTNLTHRTQQLEEERDFLNVTNKNLTQQRDGLKQQLETSCCPDKWAKFGNSCLFISSSTETWNNSKQSCEDLAAQLVVVNSQDKQEFISSLVQNAWVGLTNQENLKVWKWVDGTVVNTTFWANGQPDNWMGIEHCAQIAKGYSPINNWNDLNCISALNFICEKIMQ